MVIGSNPRVDLRLTPTYSHLFLGSNPRVDLRCSNTYLFLPFLGVNLFCQLFYGQQLTEAEKFNNMIDPHVD